MRFFIYAALLIVFTYAAPNSEELAVSCDPECPNGQHCWAEYNFCYSETESMREKERAVGVEYELETIARGNVCGDNQMAAATKEVCTRVAESMNLEVKVIAEKYFAAKYTSIPHGCYYKPYGSKGAAIFWMEKGEHFEFDIRYSGNFETNSKFIQMVCIPRETQVGGECSQTDNCRGCNRYTRPWRRRLQLQGMLRNALSSGSSSSSREEKPAYKEDCDGSHNGQEECEIDYGRDCWWDNHDGKCMVHTGPSGYTIERPCHVYDRNKSGVLFLSNEEFNRQSGRSPSYYGHGGGMSQAQMEDLMMMKRSMASQRAANSGHGAEKAIGSGKKHCGFLHTTEVRDQLQCQDGTLCTGFSCCNDRGGRNMCPPNMPIMCARENDCADKKDYCCETDCTGHGGRRSYTKCKIESLGPLKPYKTNDYSSDDDVEEEVEEQVASEKAVGGCKSMVCKMRCAKPTRPPAGCNCSACGAAQVETSVGKNTLRRINEALKETLKEMAN